jgi:hypothetical protein
MNTIEKTKTINKRITPATDGITILFDANSNSFGGVINKNIILKTLIGLSHLPSLEGTLLNSTKINDSDVEKYYRELEIEANSPNKQITLYAGKNGEWNIIAVLPLVNPSGYPYRVINLFDFVGSDNNTIIENGFALAVSVSPVLAQDEYITIYGNYIEQYLLQDTDDLTFPIALSDVSNLQAELNNKASTNHGHEIINVNGLSENLTQLEDGVAFAANQIAALGQAQSTNNNSLQSQLNNKAPINHQHQLTDVNGLIDAIASCVDTTELATALNTKADIQHNHAIIDIQGLADELASKASLVGVISELNKLFPTYSANPPSLPFSGVWHEIDNAANIIESWIHVNNRWRSLTKYNSDLWSLSSTISSTATLLLPIDIRYDYLFVDGLVNCSYNGNTVADNNTNWNCVLLKRKLQTGNTNAIAESGVIPNNNLSIRFAINQLLATVNDEHIEVRYQKTGTPVSAKIGSSFRYHLIRK